MVDSIGRTGRIGVITPPGQLRLVERRQESHKEHQDQGENESSTEQEESTRARLDHHVTAEPNEDPQTSEGNEGRSSTGRCIDVRI